MFLRTAAKFLQSCKANRYFSISIQDSSKWNEVESFFTEASSFLKSGNLPQALSHFDSALHLSSSIHPRNPELECMWVTKIASELNSFSPSSIKPYLNNALNLLKDETLNQQIKKLDTYLTLGRICAANNMADEADYVLSRSLELSTGLAAENKLEIILMLVPAKIQKNLIEEGIELCETGLELCKGEKMEVFLSGVLYQLASCFYAKGEIGKAIKFYQEAAEALEVHRDRRGQNVPLHSFEFIVDLLINEKREKEAIQYMLKVADVKRYDSKERAGFYLNLFLKFSLSRELLPLVEEMIRVADSNPFETYFIYKQVSDYFVDIGDLPNAQRNAEKLLKVIESKGTATELLGTYFLLSIIHMNQDIEEAKHYLDLATALISKNPSVEGKKPIYEVFIKYYLKKKDFNNAEKYLRLAIQETPVSEKTLSDVLILYDDLSAVLFYQSRIDESVIWQTKSLELCKKFDIGKDERVFDLLGKIGVAYCELKEFKKSLESLQEALSYIDTHFPNDHSKYISVYSLFMNVFINMNDWEAALDYGKRAEKLVKGVKVDPIFYHGAFYVQLGACYENKRELEKMLECYKEAREIFKALGEKEFVDNVENMIKRFT